MSISVRQASHPDAARTYDTARLRAEFLVEALFRPDAVELTYSHVDRIVVGGAMPVTSPLRLETDKATIGQATFLARRELGICNVGGPGRIVCEGETFQVNLRDMLYVAMGTVEVSFHSDDPQNPAKFYLFSTPAHARHTTVLVRESDANALELGTQEQANTRTLRQYIIPGRVQSCQLVMGLTTLKPGNVWNTMPSHVHDRRCEAYLYFDLKEDTRVVHLMGEPRETRHLVVANEQAIISPPWSIHSGCGTAAYSFIWAMGGDNQDFTDMDMVPMGGAAMKSGTDIFLAAGDAPWTDLGGGVKRQILTHDASVMMVRVVFEKGAVGAPHHHPHIQCTLVSSGRFEVTIGDRKAELGTGDSFIVPTNVVHSVVALEAGELVDTFTPRREDFL